MESCRKLQVSKIINFYANDNRFVARSHGGYIIGWMPPVVTMHEPGWGLGGVVGGIH